MMHDSYASLFLWVVHGLFERDVYANDKPFDVVDQIC